MPETRHWHCYSWTGDSKSFAVDRDRRDLTTSLPPLIVREWLRKPVRPAQAPTTPEVAVEWLRTEFGRYVPSMMGTQATDIPAAVRWELALHDLSRGNDISWAFWLGGAAASIVSMAVVGTSECQQH